MRKIKQNILKTLTNSLMFALFVLNYNNVIGQCPNHSYDTLCSFPGTLTINLPCGGDQTNTYSVTSIPYNADPYVGTDCFNTGYDDSYSGCFPIGFNFCFFGTSYTQINAATNGFLSFDCTNTVGSYATWPINAGSPIPTPSQPVTSANHAAIMCPWEDLQCFSVNNGQDLIKYQVLGCAPFRRFVWSIINEPFYSCTNLNFEGQAILYESTNVIEIHINHKPDCGGWNSGLACEGIQNSAGTVGYAVPGRNCTVWTVNAPEGYRFCPDQNVAPTVTWTGPGIIGSNIGTSIQVGASGTYVATYNYVCSGGTATDTFFVAIRDSIPTMSSTPDSCGNHVGTAIAIPNGGTGPYTYVWSPSGGNGSTASNLAGGLYTVTITDSQGCVATDTITVDSVASVSATGQVTQNVSCFGGNNGSAYVTPVGNGQFAYAWSPSGGNGQTASNLIAGNYTCSVTDPNNINGCVAVVYITITSPPLLTVNIAPATNLLCNGANNGSATANGVGGTGGVYTFLWSNAQNTQTSNNLAAGNYTVTVTDSNACTATATITITQPPLLTSNITGIINVLCNGSNNGAATGNGAGGTPGYTYAWSNGQNTQTINGLSPGNYTVTVTDANSCTSTSVATITSVSTIIVTSSPNATICSGASTTIGVTVSGGSSPYSYSWIPGGNTTPSLTVSPADTTIYIVTVTDASGCTAIGVPITVFVVSAPLVQFSGTPVNGCIPLTVQFTNQTNSLLPVTSISWNFGDGTAFSDSINPVHIYTTAGTFSVILTATNSANCSSSLTDSAMITAYPIPIANFLATPEITSILQPYIQFTDESTNGYSYLYEFGDNSSSALKDPNHKYTDTGIFHVTEYVTSEFGCIDSITGTVIINPEYVFFIPNAFSPFSPSSLNTLFQGYGTGIVEYEMSIYDRWGEKLFYSNDINKPWDGIFNGTQLKQDVYIYSFNIKNADGATHQFTGSVTLIR